MVTYLHDGTKETEKPIAVYTFDHSGQYKPTSRIVITRYSDSVVADLYKESEITNRHGKTWTVMNRRAYRFVIKATFSKRYNRYHLQSYYVVGKRGGIKKVTFQAHEEFLREIGNKRYHPEAAEKILAEAYSMAEAKNHPTFVTQAGEKNLALLMMPILHELPESLWCDKHTAKRGELDELLQLRMLAKEDYKVGYALRSHSLEEAISILYGKHAARIPQLAKRLTSVDNHTLMWAWTYPTYINVLSPEAASNYTSQKHLILLTTYGVGTWVRYFLFAEQKKNHETLLDRLYQYIPSRAIRFGKISSVSNLSNIPASITASSQQERKELLNLFYKITAEERELVGKRKSFIYSELDYILRAVLAERNKLEQQLSAPLNDFELAEYKNLMSVLGESSYIRLFEHAELQEEFAAINPDHHIVQQFNIKTAMPNEASITSFSRKSFLQENHLTQRKVNLFVITKREAYLFAKEVHQQMTAFFNEHGYAVDNLYDDNKDIQKMLHFLNKKWFKDQRRMMMLFRSNVSLDNIKICYKNKLKKSELEDYKDIPTIWLEELFA